MANSDVAVIIAPRTEHISWSLYWKEPLHIQTKVLEDVNLDAAKLGVAAFEQLTGEQLLQALTAAMGWRPVDKLHRIQGFKDPWERLIVRGRELQQDKPLAEQGVTNKDRFVVVRRVLNADGWRIAQEDDFLLSSDDESDA